MPYKIHIYEVDDIVKRRHPDKPCLYVCIRKHGKNGQELPGHVEEWAKSANPKLRSDLTPDTMFHRRESARKRKVKLINSLGAKGYTVNRCTTVYSLYVIELEPDQKNGKGVTSVYVGETAKTPDERFQQHKNGIKANNHVKERGLHLRPDLSRSRKCYSRDASRAEEAWLAERLSKKGYDVHGGH